jgi:hypothetical protein
MGILGGRGGKRKTDARSTKELPRGSATPALRIAGTGLDRFFARRYLSRSLLQGGGKTSINLVTLLKFVTLIPVPEVRTNPRHPCSASIFALASNGATQGDARTLHRAGELLFFDEGEWG